MIHVICISDGHKHFSEAIQLYLGRLGKNIILHTLKPVKHTEISYIRREETKKLLEKLAKLSGQVFLCDERGKDMDTMGFAKEIQGMKDHGDNSVFIIGGSYGVDLDLLETLGKVQLIRLSHFVLPHGLALLVLIEQIYRAHEIMKGSGYHHT